MDNALVVALIRAHLLTDLSYMSWVPHYAKVRFDIHRVALVAQWVGGHWRRKAHCKRTLDALACVCKQTELADVGGALHATRRQEAKALKKP